MVDEDFCEEPMPDDTYWVNPNVVGCRNCQYLNAYFECGHELEHDCSEWSKN